MIKKTFLFILPLIFLFNHGFVNGDDKRCGILDLSDQDIFNIIDSQRKIRKDLPPALENPEKYVARGPCHYRYLEALKDKYLPVNRIFIINKNGEIVDAFIGIKHGHQMTCPATELTLEYLSLKLKELRLKDSSIPPSPEKYSSEIEKIGCMYWYTEIEDPKLGNRNQNFIFDFNGELYDYYPEDYYKD